MKKQKNKNPKRKKVFVFAGIGLGIIGLGGLAYWYFKGRKGAKVEDPENDFLKTLSEQGETKSKSSFKSPAIPKPNAANPSGSEFVHRRFPVKTGSKGDLVKKIQNALIKAYGKNILPKYGADGEFGPELTKALTSKGYPTEIDESTFNKIITTADPIPAVQNAAHPTLSASNAIKTAKNIWLGSTINKLSEVLDALKEIRNAGDYRVVNELLKNFQLKGKPKTIVNLTLSSFTDDTSKQLIRNEFIRMGLKYEDGKWSLSGMSEKQIMTTQQTAICCPDGRKLKVPGNTLLGFETGRYLTNTRFRTLDNKKFYVATKHIRYVQTKY